MKKFLAIILAVITILSVSTVAMSAHCAPLGGESSQVSNINIVNFLPYEFRLSIVEAMVNIANAKIDFLVDCAIAARNPDLGRLVEKTNQIAQDTIDAAAKLGITVACELVAYEIHGVIVYIDPLIVIRM